MNEHGYEVYGRGFGWTWGLRDGPVVLATGGRHDDDSLDTRHEIDRVRAALAHLAGEDLAFASVEVRDPRFVVGQDLDPSGASREEDDWVWRLETPDRVLAHSGQRYPTEAAAREGIARFEELGRGVAIGSSSSSSIRGSSSPVRGANPPRFAGLTTCSTAAGTTPSRKSPATTR